MEIREEVIRRSLILRVKDWRAFYEELRNILEQRYDIHQVVETQFKHYGDVGEVDVDLEGRKRVDTYTIILLEMNPVIKYTEDHAEVDLEVKGTVVTTYPEETEFQQSLLYFALRSIWDRLFYGFSRNRWKEVCKNLVIDILSDLKAYEGVKDIRR